MIAAPHLEQVLAELPEAPERAALVVERFGAEVVAAEARQFALTPLLAHYLPGRFLLQQGEELSARFLSARLERLSLEALAILEKANVRAALLKGLELATRLYPEAWLRPSVDVDVLVASGEFETAARALAAAGWKQAGDPPRTAFEFSKDLAFLAPGGGMLELHFGYNADFQARVDAQALIARSHVVQLKGGVGRVLAAEDSLLVQCVHAAHHAFTGVKWLFDLKLEALAEPGCWDALVERAHEYRVASAVGMSLREATRRVRATVPVAVLRRLPPGPLRALAVRRASAAEGEDLPNLLGSLLLADGLSLGLLEEAAVRPLGRILNRAGVGTPAKRAAWIIAERLGIMRRRLTTPGSQ